MPTEPASYFLTGLLALMALIAAGADLGGEWSMAYNAGRSAVSTTNRL